MTRQTINHEVNPSDETIRLGLYIVAFALLVAALFRFVL